MYVQVQYTYVCKTEMLTVQREPRWCTTWAKQQESCANIEALGKRRAHSAWCLCTLFDCKAGKLSKLDGAMGRFILLRAMG